MEPECIHTPTATTLPSGARVCATCAEAYFKALLAFAVRRTVLDAAA